jgi:hypothetical protein
LISATGAHIAGWLLRASMPAGKALAVRARHLLAVNLGTARAAKLLKLRG